jgi:hypothetical protein
MTTDFKLTDQKYQKLTSDLCVILAMEKKVDAHCDIQKHFLSKSRKNEYNTEILTELFHSNKIFLKYSRLFSRMNGCISDVLFRHICLLFYCLRNKEIKIFQQILYDILYFEQNDIRVCKKMTKQEMKIDQFILKDSSFLRKEQHSDIVWVIWQGLLNFVKKYHPDIYEDMNELFTISQINYKKKDKCLRMNILIRCFYFLCKEKNCFVKNVHSDKLNILEKVANKIYILFDEVKENVKNTKQEAKDNKQRMKKRDNENNQNVIDSDYEDQYLNSQNSQNNMKKSKVVSESEDDFDSNSHSDSFSICSSVNSITFEKPEFPMPRHSSPNKTFPLPRKSKELKDKKINPKNNNKKKCQNKDKESCSESSDDLPDYMNILLFKK